LADDAVKDGPDRPLGVVGPIHARRGVGPQGVAATGGACLGRFQLRRHVTGRRGIMGLAIGVPDEIGRLSAGESPVAVDTVRVAVPALGVHAFIFR
jgi:hypothetical protein